MSIGFVSTDNYHGVVYTVTSTGPTEVSVTYTDGNSTQTRQESEVDVPWTRKVKTGGSVITYQLVAQNRSNSPRGSITCTITAKGKEVSTNTSKGPEAIATCTYTP